MSKLDQSSVATVPFHGAFTMSTGKRSSVALNTCSPGPAAYHLETVNKKPKGINMNGKDKRNVNIVKNVPSVGTYDIKASLGVGSKWTIQKRREPNIIKDSNIGPGMYNPTNYSQRSSPNFSFQSKFDLQSSQMTPGPQTYQQKEFDSLQKYSFQFGHSNRVDQNEIKSALLPGPGSYQQDKLYSNQSHNYQFSKDQRFKQGSSRKIDEVPGPGTFDIIDTSKSQKSFSFGGKYSSTNNKLLVPGPGTYNISDITQNKINSIKFGSSKRKHIQGTNDYPGPGTYNIENSVITETDELDQLCKNNSQRSNFANMQQIPGPGTYNLPTTVGVGPKWIMKSGIDQSKWTDKKILPGPGNYDIRQELKNKNNQAPKFSVSKRLQDNDRNNFPGPTAYESIQYHMKKSPKYTFTQTKRDQDQFQELFEPSPNSYEIKSSISGLPTYMRNDTSLNNSKIK